MILLRTHRERFRRRLRRLQRAFTLAEVSIATGMAAFGMLAVLGMMPLAFDTMEEANSSGIEARIGSQILDELRTVPFEALPEFGGTLRYFDFDGVRLEEPTNSRLHFVALILVQATPQIVPGGEAPVAGTSGLRRVEVRLTSRPGAAREDFDFSAPENSVHYKSFEGSIVRMGEQL